MFENFSILIFIGLMWALTMLAVLCQSDNTALQNQGSVLGIATSEMKGFPLHKINRKQSTREYRREYIRDNTQNGNGFVKYAYFWKIQTGGSNAPSLGSESKYANGLDDPRLNAAVFKEKGQKNSPKIQFWDFWKTTTSSKLWRWRFQKG